MILRSAFLILVAALATAQDKPARAQAKVALGKNDFINITVVKPKGYDKKKQYPVVFALSPGDGSAKMVDISFSTYWEAEAWSRGYLVVCPETVSAAALELTDMATRFQAMVPAVFAWMDKNVSYDKKRVILTGVSAGGSAMFHMAVAHSERFCGLIGLPAARLLKKPDDLKPLKGRPVWLLLGADDKPMKDSVEDTLAALKAAGADATLEVLPGQGHVLAVEPKKLFDWMDALKPAK